MDKSPSSGPNLFRKLPQWTPLTDGQVYASATIVCTLGIVLILMAPFRGVTGRRVA